MTPRALVAAVIAMLGAAAVAVALAGKLPKSCRYRYGGTHASFSANVLVARSRRAFGADVPHRQEPRRHAKSSMHRAYLSHGGHVVQSRRVQSWVQAVGLRLIWAGMRWGVGSMQPLSEGHDVSVGWHSAFAAVSLFGEMPRIAS